MIEIDFSTPIGQVRAIIGDPSPDIISDNSIQSALDVNNDDVGKASIMIMQMLVRAFSTMADREREGQVEVYYTKLYERYKQELKDLERKLGAKKGIPVIIGGVSLEERNKVYSDVDTTNVYDQDAINDIMLRASRLCEAKM